MKNNKKCIGVLTSGGDAPGMNAAIRAVVRTAISRDIIPVGVLRGYNGLLNEDYKEMTLRSVSDILQRGGTAIYTARCLEFLKEENREIAYKNAIKAGLDGLIVIGGDGSYKGARALSNLGLPCIGIPGTIDNDIACTDYTIGYDTAMNTVVEIVDKIRDSCQSHHRCSVIEVMGRYAGHVALNTGIACGAIAIITKEHPIEITEVTSRIMKEQAMGREHFIIIVSEGHGKTVEIAQQIQDITGIDTRASILGHVQRGGSPSLRDRVVASQMGHYAVELLDKGIGRRVVAIKDDKLVDYDINEALDMQKTLDENLYKIVEDISL